MSVDPLASSFPFYTPYQFAGNKPINSIDLDGLEEFEVYKQDLLQEKTTIEIESYVSAKNNVIMLTMVQVNYKNNFAMWDEAHNVADLTKEFERTITTTTTYAYINRVTGKLESKESFEETVTTKRKASRVSGFMESKYTLQSSGEETTTVRKLVNYETPLLDGYIEGAQDAILKDHDIGAHKSHNEAILAKDRDVKSSL